MRIEQPINVPALTTPAGSPTAGRILLYVKSDGSVYTKDSGGTERTSTLTPAASVVANTSYGLSMVVGTSLLYARQDHSHGSASLTAATPANLGTAAVGVGTLAARDDHIHGKTGLVKGDVGLGNVDNTSDVNKPVSTAQATADALAIPLTQRASASGVATLDGTTKIPIAQVPTIPLTSGGTGAITAAAARTALAVPSTSFLLSRAQNLVSNGTAYLGDNTNFSGFTYDGAETPGGGGGFRPPQTNATVFNDEFIPVDPAKSYTLEAWAREKTASLVSYLYVGLALYDIDGNQILPSQVMWSASTSTTLAATLNVGDTTITLTSASGWNNAAGASSYLRSLIAWNYINARGYAWPVRTYSRNTWPDIYADGGITGNVITLRVPWAGPVIPAGTAVNNATSGGTFKYIAAANATPGNTWTKYSGSIGGIDLSGTAVGTAFSPGTASIKILMLPNRDLSPGNYLTTANQVFANFWFSELHPTNFPASSITGDKLATTLSGAHTFSGALTLSAALTGTSAAFSGALSTTGAANMASATDSSLAIVRTGGAVTDWNYVGFFAGATRTSYFGTYSGGDLSFISETAGKAINLQLATGPLLSVGTAATTITNRTAIANIPLVVKGMAGQTNSLQQWQDSTAAIVASLSATGVANVASLRSPVIEDSTATGPSLTLGTASMVLANRTTVGNIPLVVKGMASQSGDLQQWQNSAGSVLAAITLNGYVHSNLYDSAGSNSAYISMVGSGGIVTTARYDAVQLTVRGHSTLTADIQQWTNSSATVLASVSATGAFTSTTTITGTTGVYDGANRVYSLGNAPPAPSNMVTTDTGQTITGAKLFTNAGTYAVGLQRGSKIDLDTSGTQGYLIAEATAGTTFTDSAIGDQCYREANGQTLRLGTAGAAGVAQSSTMRITGSGIAITGTLSATTTITATTTVTGTTGVYDGANRVYSLGNLPNLIEPYVFSYGGTLVVTTGTQRLYLDGNFTLDSVRIGVGTAPTGAAVIADVTKNGTTIFTTTANRPTIAVSTFTALAGTAAVNTFVAGDYLTVDIDQIGSTIAGADLTVTVRLRRTS